MQVIFGKQQKETLGDKFTILELDTFMQEGLPEPVTAYAVIGANDTAVEELSVMDNHTRLHNDMLKEYRNGNWHYCKEALGHLRGKWRKNLDSFYDEFESRINELSAKDLPDGWDGVIHK